MLCYDAECLELDWRSGGTFTLVRYTGQVALAAVFPVQQRKVDVVQHI